MLVLSRKPGQEICVGGGIVITLVAVRGGTARIGIEAPADVPVDREEVYQRKKAAKAMAHTDEGRSCELVTRDIHSCCTT